MRNYEVTFIVDPVLSGDEIKTTAQTYVDMLQERNCKIVHVDEMGLRQLAYPINKRSSGVYYCIEFQSETGDLIDEIELALRRDERLMRFLTVALDKYGIKYNEDKRGGRIGKKRKVEKAAAADRPAAPAPAAKAPVAEKPAPVAPAPAAPVAPAPAAPVAPAPVAPVVAAPVAPVVETPAAVEEEE